MSEISSTSPMDATDYLMHRGESNPRTRSGFLGVEILDRVPDWDRFVASFERASRVVARLRQKVVQPSLPTASARWVIDPDFTLRYHVRRVRAPEPGDLRCVLDLADVILQSPLDTARALWTVTLVEGLDADVVGGPAAVLSHLSHAVTDGVGGIELFQQIYDLERDPLPRPLPPRPIPDDLSPNELARSGMVGLPRTVVNGARGLVGGAAGALGAVVRNPVDAVGEVVEYARSGARVMAAGPDASPLLRGRSLATRCEAVALTVPDLHRAAKAAGGSLNDAYLAGVCGALRRYHDALGVPIDLLPMSVPVNLRTDADPSGGNRFAGITVEAPIGETDPAARIALIRAQIRTQRDERAIGLFGVLAPVLSVLPQPVVETLVGSIHQPDVQASNVPGYAQDTYIAGAQVLRQFALGPLPGVAVMVVMVTRAGTCTVTARYDAAAVTHPELFGQCLRDGFTEVLELGGEHEAVELASAAASTPATTASPAAAAAASPADHR